LKLIIRGIRKGWIKDVKVGPNVVTLKVVEGLEEGDCWVSCIDGCMYDCSLECRNCAPTLHTYEYHMMSNLAAQRRYEWLNSC